MSASDPRFCAITIDNALRLKALENAFGFQNNYFFEKYDPELLYVECQVCGKPVLWGKGKTTSLLESSGIDITTLDAHCMLVSDGCQACKAEAGGYTLAIVRVTEADFDDALQMMPSKGYA